MLESDLKRTVAEYLEYKTNQGVIYADRLFTGEAIEVRGKTRRRIKGCRAGTADFIVLKWTYPKGAPCWTSVIFLELKGDKGKTSPAQNAFKILVEKQGAEYYVIKSIEQVIKLVEGIE